MVPQNQRIAELEVQLAQAPERSRSLEEENSELRARLGQSSTNSSRPPSQDPPQLRRKPKPPSGRRRGGQPGHPRHEREPTLPNEAHEQVPAKCDLCGGALKGVDPEPLRHQFIDIVSGRRHVIEYRLHALACRRCGHRTRASLPPVLSWRIFGATLTAIVALLTGKYRMSKRLVRELLQDLFALEVSLGAICDLEQDMSAALAAPVEEVQHYARQQPIANMDETGWWESQANGRKAASPARMPTRPARNRSAGARELLWDYEVPADPESDEAFVALYVGRALDRGSADDLRSLGLPLIRRFLDVAPTRREVTEFWRWWLSTPDRSANGDPDRGAAEVSSDGGDGRGDPV